MATTPPDSFETVAPSATDSRLAMESSARLAAHAIERQKSVRIQLLVDGDVTEAVDVPTSAMRLFLQVLAEMSQGHAVTLLPTHAELTTQQAADLLNVSRPFLVKLLDEGRLPCRTVGKYRRVRLDDVMAFKRQDDEARSKVLEQLTAEAQELGLGY